MTLTTYANVEQGTEQWHDLRRGIVTASTVGKLITHDSPPATDVGCDTCGSGAGDPCISIAKGKTGALKTVHPARAATAREAALVLTVDTVNDFAWNLMAERITGVTEDTYVSNDMMRGVLCEPIARDAYSTHYAPAVEVGFMRRDEDDWCLGWSPDGLVGDVGAIEIKAPRAKKHIKTILADEVPADNVAQCQAALLVSGREWLDFVSFHGGLPLFVKRVWPNPEWHTAIRNACRQFEQMAAENTTDYNRAVEGLHPTERVDYDMEVMI